ncbi:hypothetical protein BofuT4_P089280.1 [Botrytis cinerea T4]|uniref:Uncharacterized protein n=1 Tax=Botryotinia fuckeliana (strain T4) TaxID=999810 RepID=G2YFI1_BOTF4|nr:hypothetical protein BofuT4_P089280.1 [Botrytis cinerea T4]
MNQSSICQQLFVEAGGLLHKQAHVVISNKCVMIKVLGIVKYNWAVTPQ